VIKVPSSLFARKLPSPEPIWKLNDDGSYDVDGDVCLNSQGITKLPYKFGRVTGHFICDRNKLTTLEGSPKIVGGGFYCYHNKLISLDGAPTEVGGDFYCDHNSIKFNVEDVKKVCNVKGMIYV
jgi:hypothetical protein